MSPLGSCAPRTHVEALAEDDWRRLRALRFAALREAPDAFGPTVDAARQEPEAYWRRWAGGGPAGRAIVLVATRDGVDVALISGSVDERAVGHIGAMWVDPSARGIGIAARLLRAMLDALPERGAVGAVRLWVTSSNEVALSLYERRGFRRTGTAHPLRSGSPLDELELELRLDADV